MLGQTFIHFQVDCNGSLRMDRKVETIEDKHKMLMLITIRCDRDVYGWILLTIGVSRLGAVTERPAHLEEGYARRHEHQRQLMSRAVGRP